jgi:uncharacterized DUF497 family protein
MRFEFDPVKSVHNREKHGIDFEMAQAIWTDPDRLETPARWVDEPRTRVLGRIGQTVWAAIVTMRHENTTIRLISVRRARPEEVRAYEEDRADAPRPSEPRGPDDDR